MINLKENKKIIIYCRLGNEEENQYLLKCCEKNVNLIKSTNNNDFEKIKEISAIYQNNLLKKELKDKDIEIEY